MAVAARLRGRLCAVVDDEGGASPVEFVLVGTLLTMLTLGVLQLGLAIYVRNVLHDAAVEGAYHAALAGADGFTLGVVDGEARADLESDAVRAQADALVSSVGGDAVVVSAGTPDGVSARVTVAGSWHPPVLTLFVPEGVALEATATSRTALR